MDFAHSTNMVEEPSWMTSLVYPLIMLGIGTAITYFLGTTLTRKYQEKQKIRDIEREDLHRSIAIKDDLIRQFSDTIGVVEKIVMSTFLLHEKDTTKDWLSVLVGDFNDFQSKSHKILLLLKLYFGENNKVYEEFSTYIVMGLIIKNYAILEDNHQRENLKNNINGLLEKLDPKKESKATEEGYLNKIGIPNNFYTEITSKTGSWGSEFSQKILDAKLKPEVKQAR